MSDVVGKYGPAVLGAARAAEEQTLAVQQAVKYGPLVLGAGSEPAAPEAPAETPPPADTATPPRQDVPESDTGFVPVNELTDVLAAEPERFDALFAQEQERPDGPRRAAIWIFQQVEGQKPAPRVEVLDACAAVLG